jgi:hypothetical protein
MRSYKNNNDVSSYLYTDIGYAVMLRKRLLRAVIFWRFSTVIWRICFYGLDVIESDEFLIAKSRSFYRGNQNIVRITRLY